MRPFTPSDLGARYATVRRHSLDLAAPLSPEDQCVQPMPDASPTKWHLAHTTWFFETLALAAHAPGHRPYDARWAPLFNSYYESLGPRHPRPQRGLLTRPSLAEVHAYRAAVDAAMLRFIEGADGDTRSAALPLVELGLQHEQQHQELLVTDIKFILGVNARPALYDPQGRSALDLTAEHDGTCPPLDEWIDVAGGTIEVGHTGRGFAFDNESPRHTVLVGATQLRLALVTNQEYLDFMADGGYERHELWHAEGWDWVRTLSHKAPLYWHPDGSGRWQHFTLGGVQPLERSTAPVSHVSYYEAFAFCQWAGWRLPTEFEWEAGAAHLAWGRRWEWTQSAYQPYPGFRRSAGAVGEYNGKFMVDQQVLRGASFATPPGHARLTYRNFLKTPQRWQFTGIRPARDVRDQGHE